MFDQRKDDNYQSEDPENERYWRNYDDYRFILWLWMLNDGSLVWAVAELSHSGFYIHATIHFIAVIFIGIPLAYSEICVAQYTNCDAISMWKFFPLFRSVGYGTIYLVVIKTIYTLVITSWFLVYTIHSFLDPPPWFSCDEFNDTNHTYCMIKRINISIYQHCLETQNLYNEDCGMKTASCCFFEREIGDHTTQTLQTCIPGLKLIMITGSLGLALFLVTLKRRFLAIAVKIVLFYVGGVMLVLFGVAFSTSGTWYATKSSISWGSFTIHTCFVTLTRGFLSLGTGTGIITYLSRRVEFRSPATMTSISSPLVSIFITLMFSLIVFSGIKTMSYYHGEEENVIEMGDNYFFAPFASVSEILSYFDAMPIWGFAWFSSIFCCLFIQLWILFRYLRTFFFSTFHWTSYYKKSSSIFLLIVLILLSYPYFCSDLTPSLIDAVDFIQLISSFLFSVSLYWFYGYSKHNVDIVFMIGVKASYFWKIAWLINPIVMCCLLYTKLYSSATSEYQNSYKIESLNLGIDHLVLFLIISIYALIVFFGFVFQILLHVRQHRPRSLFISSQDWGPQDHTLLKSRKMFVPEIMTREFLYRQVKIHGYCKKKPKSIVNVAKPAERKREDVSQATEFSTLTSN